MTDASRKMRSIVDIARFYGRHPRRAGEVCMWSRHRGRTTLELKMPWWNYSAIDAVDSFLPHQAEVFEYGGGGSTLWLIDRGARVTTVEHDRQWHEVLTGSSGSEVELIYQPASSGGETRSVSAPGLFFDDYVNTINRYEDNSFDLVIVDGRARVECVRHAAPKIKPGGIMLLDDSDREQYAEAGKILSSWSRSDHRGVKPGGGGTVATSLWRKPA